MTGLIGVSPAGYVYRHSLLINIFFVLIATGPSHFSTILSAYIAQAQTDLVVEWSRHDNDAMTGDRFVL
jgi:hypothetical protein